MGQVADTSLRALEQERANLRYPFWLQRLLFFRKAKGIHGVHSPLAYRLATEVFMKHDKVPSEVRLESQLPGFSFQSITLPQLTNALSFLEQNKDCALWVKGLENNRAQWLQVCTDPRVTIAIDCFYSGLLLHTSDVKEKQYLRQKALGFKL